MTGVKTLSPWQILFDPSHLEVGYESSGTTRKFEIVEEGLA
jgi:hypothetical protein